MSYLPVNVIGRIIIIIITSKPKPANVQAFLKSVEEAHVSRKVPWYRTSNTEPPSSRLQIRCRRNSLSK